MDTLTLTNTNAKTLRTTMFTAMMAEHNSRFDLARFMGGGGIPKMEILEWTTCFTKMVPAAVTPGWCDGEPEVRLLVRVKIPGRGAWYAYARRGEWNGPLQPEYRPEAWGV